MRILITGAKGFVGKNVVANLLTLKDVEVFQYDLDCTEEQLADWTGKCDFVIHLAGVNRPKDESEFRTGNTDFTAHLLSLLDRNPVPVAMTSSIQAVLDNPYGNSKLAAEEEMFSYAARNHVPVYV